MTPNYPYHFLQAFYNELIGRYAHLQQYVERTRLETGNKSPKLLEVYSRQLSTRINEIIDSAQDFSTPFPDSINPVYLIDIFHYLQKESNKFQQLHRTLRWFSAPWPEAEVFQFLSQTFEETGLKNSFHHLNPSIVFSDEYNFLTYDVGYVQKGISRSELTAWAIPKSESSNPLLWSVLVHEVAHSLFKDDTIFNHITTILATNHFEETIELVRRWGVELNADLFAFRILGPAYLYSLMYFSMFFVSENLRKPIISERKDTRSLHPPPETRVRLLLREAHNLKLDDNESTKQFRNSLDVFQKLFNERLAFDYVDGFEALDYKDLLLSEVTLDELWETLKQFQDDYFDSDALFSNADVVSASKLSERLMGGILAGSLATEFDPEVLHKFIEHEPDVSRKDALSKLNECSARMIDIVNAGWINQVDGRFWKVPLFEELKHLDKDRDLKLPHLLDSLAEPARQLQTSIQVALILSSLI
jgi:hypothetical protein